MRSRLKYIILCNLIILTLALVACGKNKTNAQVGKGEDASTNQEQSSKVQEIELKIDFNELMDNNENSVKNIESPSEASNELLVSEKIDTETVVSSTITSAQGNNEVDLFDDKNKEVISEKPSDTGNSTGVTQPTQAEQPTSAEQTTQTTKVEETPTNSVGIPIDADGYTTIWVK